MDPAILFLISAILTALSFVILRYRGYVRPFVLISVVVLYACAVVAVNVWGIFLLFDTGTSSDGMILILVLLGITGLFLDIKIFKRFYSCALKPHVVYLFCPYDYGYVTVYENKSYKTKFYLIGFICEGKHMYDAVFVSDPQGKCLGEYISFNEIFENLGIPLSERLLLKIKDGNFKLPVMVEDYRYLDALNAPSVRLVSIP